MSCFLRRVPFSVILAGCVLAGSAAGRAAEVKDEAAYFSPAARAKADEAIRAIRAAHQKSLVIETYKEVPADKRKRYEEVRNRTEARSAFFAGWAGERLAANKADICLLISREGGRIEIAVADGTLKKGFPLADRNKLRDRLLTRFKAREYDQALREATFFVDARLDANLPPLNVVRDRADFFTPAAVARANQTIKSFRTAFQRDLTIETFKTVPAAKVRAVETMSADERARFFADWLEERGKGSAEGGIYVLICRQPARVEVGVGTETRKKAFTEADRNKLRDLLVVRLRAKEYDQGLTAATDHVFDTVDRNLTPVLPALKLNAVADHGKLFSEGELRKAGDKLAALKRDRKVDVTLETVPRPEPGQTRQVEAMNADGRAAYFRDWMQRRAMEGGVKGVYVLICRQPGFVRVGVGAEPLKGAFTAGDRDGLRALLTRGLNARAYDATLRDGVAYLDDTLRSNPVRDGAGYFSAAAIDKANAALKDLRRQYHRDLLIATYEEVPPGRAAGVDFTDRAAKSKFFTGWGHDLLKEAGDEGILVLICKKQTYLDITADPETSKRAFGSAEARDLRDLLLAKLKARQYDQGLADAIDFVGKALKASMTRAPGTTSSRAAVHTGGEFLAGAGVPAAPPPRPPAQPPVTPPTKPVPVTPVAADKRSGGVPLAARAADGDSQAEAPPRTSASPAGGFKYMWVIWIIVGLIVLWILIALIRALFGGGSRNPYAETGRPGQPWQPAGGTAPAPAPGYAGAPGPPPGGGGGGGFLPSLLGGMFGGAAGSWMYDSFIRKSSQPGAAGAPAARPLASSSADRGDQGAGGAGGGSAGEPAERKYASAGGDFGEEPAERKDASAGGDFGEEPAERKYASAGGDFGEDTRRADAGGDFGEDSAERKGVSAGGDFGEDTRRADAGGDFGEEPAERKGVSAGGDFGEDTRRADADSGESAQRADAGGDFGEDTRRADAGGDFGESAQRADAGGDFGEDTRSADAGAGGDFGGDQGAETKDDAGAEDFGSDSA